MSCVLVSVTVPDDPASQVETVWVWVTVAEAQSLIGVAVIVTGAQVEGGLEGQSEEGQSGVEVIVTVPGAQVDPPVGATGVQSPVLV